MPSDDPWWMELPPDRRWVHEYLHVNGEHVLGRKLDDVNDKVSGNGRVSCKCAVDGEVIAWVTLTDPHDVPLPDLSFWPEPSWIDLDLPAWTDTPGVRWERWA